MQYGLHVCCCLGLLTSDQAKRLRGAGVDRINHNLNTSRRYYDRDLLHPLFDDRMATLRISRDAGMELCCGLIVGMGELDDDVVDVARELREIGVESIPVNFLHAIPGTPLENTHVLNPRYCLKVLCLMRLANPTTEIRIAGGREVNLRSLQPLGLYPANSLFVSDYLTTKGQPAEDDYRMVDDLGFEIVVGDHLGEQPPSDCVKSATAERGEGRPMDLPPAIELAGCKVTVMGLGRFGGGLGAVRFLTARGARVTVTDLLTAEDLSEPLAKLADCPVDAYHLGGHVEEDFVDTDLIVVNPAVPPSSPFLDPRPRRVRAAHQRNVAVLAVQPQSHNRRHRQQRQIDDHRHDARHLASGRSPLAAGGKHRHQPAARS